MRLAEFIDSFKEAIARLVAVSYPPLYRPAEDTRPVPALLRRPKGGQADAIRAAALSITTERGTQVVGEMGTGKTLIAVAAASMAGLQRMLVICPPHMVVKWRREVLDTLPGAKAVIVRTITDLEAVRKLQGAGPLFVILSREQAKLSYRWKPAYLVRPLTHRGRLLRNEETGAGLWQMCCPRCCAQILGPKGVPLDDAGLRRQRLFCQGCGGALWQADKAGPRRYALADYIKLRMRGFFDLLIADEVHEFKARGAAQALAVGALADVLPRVLTLTGTLAGGYASTLFYLLYRFSPRIRTEFNHGEESRWIQWYGFVKETRRKTRSGEAREDGRMSRRRNYTVQTKELPGLAPQALFHLIPNTVFIRLSDVADDLPSYREEVRLMGLDTTADREGYTQSLAYHELYRVLRKAMEEALVAGSRRLLSVYLQSLLAYPDGCTRGETVIDPETDGVLVEIPPLAADKLYPKEKALLELVREERAQGRRVLVYVTHTASRDITGRLKDTLVGEGYQAVVMKADTVAPADREGWIEQRLKEGAEVLICHPKLVQTGLDLVAFPTVCWFETEYSVYTMRQASRRSWRIGQTLPVRVLFFAYRGTIQAEALRLVAKKLQSSLAVEGELPEEGLSVYKDDGSDWTMALARQLVRHVPNDEAVEEVFARASREEAASGEFLVDDGWRVDWPLEVAVTPEERPEPVGVDQEQLVMSLSEFVGPPPSIPGRRRKAPPSVKSLFEWALESVEASKAQD